MTTSKKTSRLLCESNGSRAVLVEWENQVSFDEKKPRQQRVIVIETADVDALGEQRWNEVCRYDRETDDGQTAVFDLLLGDDYDCAELPAGEAPLT